jgi:hypothetical protein
MKILTKKKGMMMMTDWSTTKRKFNYFRTKEQQLGDENLTFSPRELADELTVLLRKAKAEGYYEEVKRRVKAALDGDTTNPENPEAPFASPVNQGGLRYEQSHEKPTPKMSEDAEYEERRETTAADGNQRALRKMAAIYDGSNPKDKKAYSLFHHGSSGAQPLYPQAVRKIAKKLGISDEPGEGVIPVKQNPLNSNAVARGHIERHLQEISK